MKGIIPEMLQCSCGQISQIDWTFENDCSLTMNVSGIVKSFTFNVWKRAAFLAVLCYSEEIKSHRFGMTWWWVNYPFSSSSSQMLDFVMQYVQVRMPN